MYIRSSPRGPNRDPNRTLSNELLLWLYTEITRVLVKFNKYSRVRRPRYSAKFWTSSSRSTSPYWFGSRAWRSGRYSQTTRCRRLSWDGSWGLWLAIPRRCGPIPVMQEEQRALFMSVFFTGRRGLEVGGKGYERRYGGVRGDVPPAPKRPLSWMFGWLKLGISSMALKAGVVWLALNMIRQALLSEWVHDPWREIPAQALPSC